MADYLFLYSISPVQEFISQARKTQDLFAGSAIISDILRYQIKKIRENENVKLIFPAEENESVPNRFVTKILQVTEKEVKHIAVLLETHFQESLCSLAEKAIQLKLNELQLEQLLHYFTTTWSAIEIGASYEKAYRDVEKLNAGIKNMRTFTQLGNGNGEQGRKCSICGERNAYFYNQDSAGMLRYLSKKAIGIQTNKLKSHESLCTVCAMKRLYGNNSFPSTAEICLNNILLKSEMDVLSSAHIDPQILYGETTIDEFLEKEQIKTTPETISKLQKQRARIKQSAIPKYYALILFDGDHMGQLLSGKWLKEATMLEEFHIALAKALASNARMAKEIVDKVGKTVYAGGDDFMGFCNLESLLPTLKKLHHTFKQQVSDPIIPYLNGKHEVTMSAGIVVTHYKEPLHIALNWARNMETAAKEEGNRNAFTLAVLKHSGDLQKLVWKWSDEADILDHINNVIEHISSNAFSDHFIYSLEKEFSTLNYKVNQTYDKQFKTELKRLIHRSCMLTKNKDETDKDFVNRKKNEENDLFENCWRFYQQSYTQPERYFTLMRIIAFLSHKLGGE